MHKCVVSLLYFGSSVLCKEFDDNLEVIRLFIVQIGFYCSCLAHFDACRLNLRTFEVI